MLNKYSVKDFLSLRKKRIEMEYKKLNPMQREAVLHTQGPLLVLAGAGSGKTTVLINRIANIIRFGCAYESNELPPFISDADCEFLEEFIKNPTSETARMADQICSLRPASPWSIIAITFTNKAAKELKERLEVAIGEEANDVWAQTFHSACVRILRSNIEKLGFDKSFTIYDQSDSEKLVKEIIRANNIDDKMFTPKGVLNVIGKAKDNLMLPEDFAKAYSGDYRLSVISKIYSEYQKRLSSANALDFDDIIMHTVILLRDNNEVREYYQNKFKYVLIDEYQDTNYAQYMLATLLAGDRQNICVVGDDDQSIYRFRGATIENILNFEEHFKDTKTIRLEQNYRSTQNILSIANSVIANNKGRKEKELWTKNEGGVNTRLYCAVNEADESQYIAKSIFNGCASGRKLRDYAILYRINAQANNLESMLKKNGIPYRVIGSTKFYDRAEVKDMLAYLWVIHNPSDTMRLKRIINVPARKIGKTTLDKAEAISVENNISLFDVCENAHMYPELKSASNNLMCFAKLIRDMQNSLETQSVSEMYEELLNASGYRESLLISKELENKHRLENIEELKSTMLDFEKNNPENATLALFLDEISLFTDIENYDENADACVMMTIHSAKGLEFPYVFLCGVEEGIFPGVMSMGSESDIEEERRLFYVAATRAKKELCISHASSRMLFGQTSHNRPSRFVEEIPKKYLDIEQSEYVSVYTQRAYSDSTKTYSDSSTYSPKPKSTYNYQANTQKQTVKLDSFNAGDRLKHKTFGGGMVISAKPIGGDVLLEIAFDNVGTKRLMQKAAAQFLTKE